MTLIKADDNDDDDISKKSRKGTLGKFRDRRLALTNTELEKKGMMNLKASSGCRLKWNEQLTSVPGFQNPARCPL